MSSALGATICGKRASSARYDFARVVDRKRGLRQVGQIVIATEFEPRDVLDRLDQCDAAFGNLAHRADHLGMAGMADEQDVLALFDLAFGLAMDLAHQRAGRVHIEHLAPLGFRRDCLGARHAH